VEIKMEKTADWYRENYPGFPEEYYEVFEAFSKNNSPVVAEENVDSQLGGEDSVPQ
jgi:hypothetical protein